MSKKETFALRDKELVWLENPPVKPNRDDYDLSNPENYGAYGCAIYTYDQALTQAIADAPVVKEGRKEILLKIFPAGSALVDMDLLTEGTPYEVEIEGEMEVYDEVYQSPAEHAIDPNQYYLTGRQVCRLIPKPKQENDMKETCETCNGTGLVGKTIHTDNGDFDADDQTCEECGGHGVIHFPNEERLSEQCQACESTGRAKQDREEVKPNYGNSAPPEQKEEQEALKKEIAQITNYVHGGRVDPKWEGLMIPVVEFNELIAILDKFTIQRNKQSTEQQNGMI